MFRQSTGRWKEADPDVLLRKMLGRGQGGSASNIYNETEYLQKVHKLGRDIKVIIDNLTTSQNSLLLTCNHHEETMTFIENVLNNYEKTLLGLQKLGLNMGEIMLNLREVASPLEDRGKNRCMEAMEHGGLDLEEEYQEILGELRLTNEKFLNCRFEKMRLEEELEAVRGGQGQGVGIGIGGIGSGDRVNMVNMVNIGSGDRVRGEVPLEVPYQPVPEDPEVASLYLESLERGRIGMEKTESSHQYPFSRDYSSITPRMESEETSQGELSHRHHFRFPKAYGPRLLEHFVYDDLISRKLTPTSQTRGGKKEKMYYSQGRATPVLSQSYKRGMHYPTATQEHTPSDLFSPQEHVTKIEKINTELRQKLAVLIDQVNTLTKTASKNKRATQEDSVNSTISRYTHYI